MWDNLYGQHNIITVNDNKLIINHSMRNIAWQAHSHDVLTSARRKTTSLPYFNMSTNHFLTMFWLLWNWYKITSVKKIYLKNLSTVLYKIIMKVTIHWFGRWVKNNVKLLKISWNNCIYCFLVIQRRHKIIIINSELYRSELWPEGT